MQLTSIIFVFLLYISLSLNISCFTEILKYLKVLFLDTSKEKKTFTKKETRTKNMSNAEIMARSSIFNDTPKWRSEIMFEKLKEAEEKKERQEKNMELFTQTLEKLDNEDDNTIPNEEIINVVDEEPIRKRVTPPNPARKIVNRKRCNLDGNYKYIVFSSTF